MIRKKEDRPEAADYSRSQTRNQRPEDLLRSTAGVLGFVTQSSGVQFSPAMNVQFSAGVDTSEVGKTSTTIYSAEESGSAQTGVAVSLVAARVDSNMPILGLGLILVEERLGSRYPPKTTDDAATVGRVDLGRGTAHVLLSTTSVVAGKVAEIINRLVLGRRVVAPELRSQRCPDHVVDIVSAASPDPEAGDFRRVSLASGPLADVRLDVFAG